MSILPIVHIPDPVLKRRAHKVSAVTKEVKQLIDDMVETMREAPGVGLAAPQVGVSLRIAVIEIGDEEDEEAPKKLYVLINPEVVDASEEMVLGVEGCLSVPRVMGEVNRHERLVVRSLNRQGKPVKFKPEGWLARIFQHEIDHLNGVIFTERAERAWMMSEEEEFVDNV